MIAKLAIARANAAGPSPTLESSTSYTKIINYFIPNGIFEGLASGSSSSAARVGLLRPKNGQHPLGGQTAVRSLAQYAPIS